MSSQVVMTRSFTIVSKQEMMPALVPVADFLNHKVSKDSTWRSVGLRDKHSEELAGGRRLAREAPVLVHLCVVTLWQQSRVFYRYADNEGFQLRAVRDISPGMPKTQAWFMGRRHSGA